MASYRSPLWRWRPGVVLPSLFLLLATLGPVLPVKDVRIVVPRAVELDKDAELRCLYNMEEDKLYQVKWYKGQDEFFRYTPAETPPEKIFDVKGVNVVMSKSDSQKVTLHKVGRETEGRYACEVSADGPSFATAMKEDRLIVVDPPAGSMPGGEGPARRRRQGGQREAAEPDGGQGEAAEPDGGQGEAAEPDGGREREREPSKEFR